MVDVFWLISSDVDDDDGDDGDDVMDAGVSLSGVQVPIWPINWRYQDKNVLT